MRRSRVGKIVGCNPAASADWAFSPVFSTGYRGNDVAHADGPSGAPLPTLRRRAICHHAAT